ncbi:MAG: cell division protein FtsH, partial [Acidobacteria bacterium]|nr:cell division protein FtsH [Acidobacteriota bacterium]
RRMVCEFGMSSLGPITFGKKDEQIFLGREINQHRDFSEETAKQIDKEVRQLVDAGYQSAVEILSGNKEAMHRMSAALLEREVLDANEIKLIIEGKDLPPVKMPTTGNDSGVQQVLKPEVARNPGLAPGHPSPA